MVNEAKAHKNLTEKREAVKLLQSLFDSDEINAKSDPAAVY